MTNSTTAGRGQPGTTTPRRGGLLVGHSSEPLQQRGVRQAQHADEKRVLNEMARLEHRISVKSGETGEEVEVLSVVAQRRVRPGSVASLCRGRVPQFSEQGPSYGAEDVRGNAPLSRPCPDLQPELAGGQRVDIRREIPQAVGQPCGAREHKPGQDHCRFGIVASQPMETDEQLVLGRCRGATRPVW